MTTTASSSTAHDHHGGFNIDDILHMDVIPGLANILEDTDSHMMQTSETKQSQFESGNGNTSQPAASGSRFSQFFSKPKAESENTPSAHPPPQQSQEMSDHRRSSITDELNDKEAFMQGFFGKPRSSQDRHQVATHQTASIKIPSPGDPSAYFAPISPAAKTENAMIPPALAASKVSP